MFLSNLLTGSCQMVGCVHVHSLSDSFDSATVFKSRKGQTSESQCLLEEEKGNHNYIIIFSRLL